MTGNGTKTGPGSPEVVTPEKALEAKELHKEPTHRGSPTEAAAEVLAVEGRIGRPERKDASAAEDAVLRAGDPDIDPALVASSGEEAPGLSEGSPDGEDIDDVGELYGIQGADGTPEGLVLGDELIRRRDAARWELNPASKEEDGDE